MKKGDETSTWSANSDTSVELFNATFFLNVTGSSDPYEAMELVRNISDKQIAGGQLTYNEKKIWMQASTAIAVLVFTPVCHQFTAASPAKPAVCCTVHVVEENYLFAFCTLEEFLPGGKKSLPSTTRQAMRSMMAGTTRTFTTNNTVYINLFEVPCIPITNDGLCTQYVSCFSSSSQLPFGDRLIPH